MNGVMMVYFDLLKMFVLMRTFFYVDEIFHEKLKIEMCE